MSGRYVAIGFFGFVLCVAARRMLAYLALHGIYQTR